MQFSIIKIILWPRNKDLTKRVIEFNLNKVNVITGGSGKGKSTLLSIVDYCLGSSKIRIPTGLIREVTEWFGVVVQLKDRQLLLARNLKLPTYELSNEMYKSEGKMVELPDYIEANHNVDDVKVVLNKLLGFVDIELNPDALSSSWDSQRPSYRNAISLNFQPQYIIANPSTLYYKADSTADREKLRVLFPYLLGAINNETLELREELKVLRKEEFVILKELKEKEELVKSGTTELKTYINLARELSLIDNLPDLDNSSDYQLILEQIQSKFNDNRIPLIEVGVTDEVATKLSELRTVEYELTLKLSSLRQRLFSLKNLTQSSVEYRNSLTVQSSRIKSINWFNEALEARETCPFCGSNSSQSHEYLTNIKRLKLSLKELGENVEDSTKVYSAEIRKTQNEISRIEKDLNGLRYEIIELEERDIEFKRSSQQIRSVFRFLGKVDQLLLNISIDEERERLLAKLGKIQERIEEILRITSDDKSEERKRFALNRIAQLIKTYAEILQPEKLEANISLDIENLTIRFTNKDGASDYLWEIGSGRNFMAYHISVILAIHEYLLSLNNSKVPSFVILDQPSQVFFPEINDDRASIGDEDIQQLKKIFSTLDLFIQRTKGGVQVILLEHAGENIWKDLSSIEKIRRWRDGEVDHALIPDDWIKDAVDGEIENGSK